MTITIDLTPQAVAWLDAEALHYGLRPVDLAQRVIEERAVVSAKQDVSQKISAKNAAAIAYLDRRLKEEATEDPEEIRRSEEEVAELTQNLNRNRVETGERPLFP